MNKTAHVTMTECPRTFLKLSLQTVISRKFNCVLTTLLYKIFCSEWKRLCL